MSDTDGIVSIHPIEDEFIYHDIIDIEDLANNKDIQHITIIMTLRGSGIAEVQRAVLVHMKTKLARPNFQ